mgnify:CR=1 FL=1
MELDEENAEKVIEEVRNELGTIFGYDKGSREAGITGEIELLEVDGPILKIALKGRFWHATDTVPHDDAASSSARRRAEPRSARVDARPS